jgi:hypothetical protein
MVVARPTGTQHCARRLGGLSSSFSERTHWVTWHQFPACGWGNSGGLEGYGVFESTSNGEWFLRGAHHGRGW